jgi:hypothetical protein
MIVISDACNKEKPIIVKQPGISGMIPRMDEEIRLIRWTYERPAGYVSNSTDDNDNPVKMQFTKGYTTPATYAVWGIEQGGWIWWHKWNFGNYG